MTFFDAYVLARKGALYGRKAWRKLTGATARPAGWQPYVPATIPRRIWIYWDQPIDTAPEIVRYCVDSWHSQNPGWQITVLNRETAGEHVTMPQLPDAIIKAHYADVLRTRLLATHGGVWADSTTICQMPLDRWLPIAAQAGYFVFTWLKNDRPYIGNGPRRLLGNWFIAANPHNPLIRAWDRMTCRYWQGRRSTANYFWHNDIVEYLRLANRACREVWERMPQYGAMPPHLLYDHFLTGRSDPALPQAIAAGAIPVHKLSWRMTTPVADIETYLEACCGGAFSGPGAAEGDSA